MISTGVSRSHSSSPTVTPDSVKLQRCPFSPNDPHNELTPNFDVSWNSQRIGQIARGHALFAVEYRGKGIFPEALKQMEEYEAALFRAGRFDEYRRAIIKGMGVSTGGAEGTLLRLTTPHHIEFWRYPEVAAQYMRQGYRLDDISRMTLENRGLVHEGAEAQELATALRENAVGLKGYVLCVLTKAWGTP